MSNASRREFLKSSGMVILAGAGGAFFTPEQFLMAQATGIPGAGAVDDDRNKPTLVTIFLRGGADSLNAIVPYGDPIYYKARPGIALKEKGGKGEEAGIVKLKNDPYWALNARLKPLVPLIEEGMCIPMVNVGSPDGTRSHFEAQDNMERGCTRKQKLMSGWLNRYLELSKKPYDKPLRGLSAMTLLPRSLRGRYPVLAGHNSAEEMEEFESVYTPQNLVGMTAREGGQGDRGSLLDDRPRGGDELLKIGQNADQTRDIITKSGANAVERIKAIDKAYKMESSGKYPGGQLGQQLSTIARVIKANVGLEVAQADYDGWDHHRGQGGAVGTHSNMLGHLADCISEFTKDLGGHMNRTLLLVQSEFGRTVQENGAQGTDHGYGGFMLAVGGNAMLHAPTKGPGIMGQHKSLAELQDNRYQLVTTDFRTVYAEALARLFAFDPYKSKIFPAYEGSQANFLNFMKQVTPA